MHEINSPHFLQFFLDDNHNNNGVSNHTHTVLVALTGKLSMIHNCMVQPQRTTSNYGEMIYGKPNEDNGVFVGTNGVVLPPPFGYHYVLDGNTLSMQKSDD